MELILRKSMLRSSLCLLIVLVVGAFLLCSSSPGQDGLELFHKMQKALGGADKIAAVSAFEDIVHAQTWNQAGDALGTVRKRTRWTRPNHLRRDEVGPGDTDVLSFDGRGGREILPDET